MILFDFSLLLWHHVTKQKSIIIKILYETESLTDNDIFMRFISRYEELGRKIYNFIKAFESGHKS